MYGSRGKAGARPERKDEKIRGSNQFGCALEAALQYANPCARIKLLELVIGESLPYMFAGPQGGCCLPIWVSIDNQNPQFGLSLPAKLIK